MTPTVRPMRPWEFFYFGLSVGKARKLNERRIFLRRQPSRKSLAAKQSAAPQPKTNAPAECLFSLERWAVFASLTTRLDAGLRLIDVAIINRDGRVLLDTLVNPGVHIPASVAVVSGIDDTAVTQAPHWQEIWMKVEDLLLAQNHLVAWSVEFDLLAMRGECGRRDDLSWTIAIDSRFINSSVAVSKFIGRECSFENTGALVLTAGPGFEWQRR